MTHAVFKLVYFIELVLISLVRRSGARRFRRLSKKEERSSILDSLLSALSSFASLVPLVYIFTPWLDFADYQLPAWIGWVGAVIFAGSGALIWKTHRDLGRSWTPSVIFRDSDFLITDGIFAYLRHPIYSAHLLWGVAQALMLHNWIAGFSYLAVILPRVLLRVTFEEKRMTEKFGDEYRRYKEKTGGIFPRLDR